MTRELEEWKIGAVAVGRGIMMIQGNTLAEIIIALEEARKEAEDMREWCCDQCGELRPGSFSWERQKETTGGL